MFCIDHRNIRLELQILPLDSLIQHEKTVLSLARKLILELKNWAKLHNPIIINENNVVIDGHHRVVAFKELKFKHIAACRINYFHKETKLRYWYRLFRSLPSVEFLRRAIEELKGDWKEVSDKNSLEKELQEDRLCCGIQQGNSFACIRFSEKIVNDATSAYEILKQIEDKLVKQGTKVEYIPCDYIREANFFSGSDYHEAVLWTPQITKEMVMDAARKQKLFTPKTTRHLIPARPLNVNVPVYWLNEDITIAVINKRFSDYLMNKEIRHIGPGQVIDGRYYKEHLFVFLDN